MTKADILALLEAHRFLYTLTEHPAVYHMGALEPALLPWPEALAKNLLIRDDRRQAYFLLTLQGDKRVDLKAFRRAQATRPLTFATADELLALLGLTPGTVSPFGLLHDGEGRVRWVLDTAFLAPPKMIGIHPNDNTATLWMHSADLRTLLETQGHASLLYDF